MSPLAPASIRTRRPAFSLMELLIVVAIIGIMAAVAIAYIGGNQREAMDEVRNQRNAQEIASLTISAEASGADVAVPGDTKATIKNLMEGRKATSGTLKGRLFQLSSLNDEEIDGASRYLQWHGDQPVYTHDRN